jgi:hypothetical protein
MPILVHILITVPSMHAVAHDVGSFKETSAIHLAREYGERLRTFVGEELQGSGLWYASLPSRCACWKAPRISWTSGRLPSIALPRLHGLLLLRQIHRLRDASVRYPTARARDSS